MNLSFCFCVGNFECNCSMAQLHKVSCFCLEGLVIQMRSFQGSILATLSFMDVEGSPCFIHVSSDFLCAASTGGFLKMWDLSHRWGRRLNEALISFFESIFLTTSFQWLKTPRCNETSGCIRCWFCHVSFNESKLRWILCILHDLCNEFHHQSPFFCTLIYCGVD